MMLFKTFSRVSPLTLDGFGEICRTDGVMKVRAFETFGQKISPQTTVKVAENHYFIRHRSRRGGRGGADHPLPQ